MERLTDIQKELLQISPLVASLPPLHPYRVPLNYFDLLPITILDRVNAGETAEHPILLQAGKNTPFEVPAGYFDHLPGNILNHIKLQEARSADEELQVLSPLLSRLDKKPPFTTPAGYFEELPQDVIAGVNAIDFVRNELESISPLMSATQNKNVYQAPVGYFDKLPAEILAKVKSLSPARLVPFRPRKRFMQYAVAAMMAGIMAVGAVQFFQDRPLPNVAGDLGGIEKISDDEIMNYLDDNSISIPENIYTASSDLKEEDVQELLTDVSDQELQQYLDQNAISKIN